MSRITDKVKIYIHQHGPRSPPKRRSAMTTNKQLRESDKELDRYLSVGIAQTEEERDRYKAECEALRTCLAETAGVAVTMLYESHKADTLKEFDVTELARMVDYTKHLADANVQVEKVYRKAWGMAHGCDGADWGGSK